MGMKSNCFKFLMICGVGFSCVRGDAALRTLPVISSWNSGTRTALIEELLQPETDINASTAEFKAWLIENSMTSGKFDSVFFSIHHDYARLDAGCFVWPGPDYRSADIEEQGRICIGQEYFATVSGKAHGIPAPRSFLVRLSSELKWRDEAPRRVMGNRVEQRVNPQSTRRDKGCNIFIK